MVAVIVPFTVFGKKIKLGKLPKPIKIILSIGAILFMIFTSIKLMRYVK